MDSIFRACMVLAFAGLVLLPIQTVFGMDSDSLLEVYQGVIVGVVIFEGVLWGLSLFRGID